MSSRQKPNLSITLPRNFTFHYTDDGPVTPGQERHPPVQPPSTQAYKIRRRARPSLNPRIFSESMYPAHDHMIPTIEAPQLFDTAANSQSQQPAIPAHGYLAPQPERSLTLPRPRTPLGRRPQVIGHWGAITPNALGESIARPLSPCSVTSDSSEDSFVSSASDQSFGGSCTSPECETGDPFHQQPSKRAKLSRRQGQAQEDSNAVYRARMTIFWTAEMDKHLWTTYMIYLQDPTVTPFKTLPGSPPPLGVCHRVAREAKRSWRGGKAMNPSGGGEFLSAGPSMLTSDSSQGSIFDSSQKFAKWPKSGSSTRKRLRELVKRKATIAPHYQRIMQSRSPSPFNSSSRSASRAAPVSSPAGPPAASDSFSIRDVQVSLTTSISETMQPNGPLARLAQQGPTTPGLVLPPTLPPNVFSNPSAPAPWASPALAPSSDNDVFSTAQQIPSDPPRLGSPFQHHTWGPSQSRRQNRPRTPQRQIQSTSAQPPRLSSPFQFIHGTYPHPSANKRRAHNAFEDADDVEPSSDAMRQTVLNELFGNSSADYNRRVRSRGFSLGQSTIHDKLTALYAPAAGESVDAASSGSAGGEASSSFLDAPQQPEIKRLGSPFVGISGRPSRARGRHNPSASLTSFDELNKLASIDQRLDGLHGPGGSQ
jgi:hypothetical protein